MKLVNCLTLVISPFLFLACSTNLPKERGNINLSFSLDPYVSEMKEIRKEKYKLGLAMSGGGFRSALFNYGALKYLYDANLLNQVDIISSVSGGGYLAYSLYLQPNEIFGESLFSNDRFLLNNCRLSVDGKLVTTYQMVKTLPYGKTQFIRLYEQEIRNTFGKDYNQIKDKYLDDKYINNLMDDIKNNKKPFWVINTTINKPKPSGWYDGVFEFTPFGRGSEFYGYKSWNGVPFSLTQAVTISGAAFKPFLSQNINFEEQKFNLYDGGGSDNSGILALIKRRVENILVVDAEHDPDYTHNIIKNLNSRLPSYGMKLILSDDYKYNKLGLYKGKIIFEGESTALNVFFVKMSYIEKLNTEVIDHNVSAYGEEKYREYQEKSKSDCSLLHKYAFNDKDLINFYTYLASSYQSSQYDWFEKIGGFNFPFFKSRFPHHSTIDQSYYKKQVLAYIGLGYLQGRVLVDAYEKNKE